MSLPLDINYYLDGFKSKDRVVLSRAITLIESQLPEHEKLAKELLKKISPQKSYVLGISGSPGAGKSSLINLLGQAVRSKKLAAQIAVITIDPSSEITGGSILGDKTRMIELSLDKDVYIRPVASKATLGGIAPKLSNLIHLLKSWSFPLVIVETVGVGQSEAAIWPLVDDLMYVVTPGAGDDLQAMKRGLLELVDLVCVNKAEKNVKVAAEVTQQHYLGALSLLQGREVKVILTSAIENSGIDELISFLAERMKKDFSSDQKKKYYLKKNAAKEILLDCFEKWMTKNNDVIHSHNSDQVIKLFLKEINK